MWLPSSYRPGSSASSAAGGNGRDRASASKRRQLGSAVVGGAAASAASSRRRPATGKGASGATRRPQFKTVYARVPASLLGLHLQASVWRHSRVQAPTATH